jgi:hypothetical protein
MNSMKVTTSPTRPPRQPVAGVNEGKALINLHAAQAPVADGALHYGKQYLLIAARRLR